MRSQYHTGGPRYYRSGPCYYRSEPEPEPAPVQQTYYTFPCPPPQQLLLRQHGNIPYAVLSNAATVSRPAATPPPPPQQQQQQLVMVVPSQFGGGGYRIQAPAQVRAQQQQQVGVWAHPSYVVHWNVDRNVPVAL